MQNLQINKDYTDSISCTAISGDAMVLAAGTCGGRVLTWTVKKSEETNKYKNED